MQVIWQHTVKQSKLLLVPAAALVPILWSQSYHTAAMAIGVGLLTLSLQWALIGPTPLPDEQR